MAALVIGVPSCTVIPPGVANCTLASERSSMGSAGGRAGEPTSIASSAFQSTCRVSARSRWTSSVCRNGRLRRKSMNCSARTRSGAIRCNVSTTGGGKFCGSIVVNSDSPRYWRPWAPACVTN